MTCQNRSPLQSRLRTGALLAATLVLALCAGPLQAADTHPQVRLVTSLGNIDIELFEQKAPKSVQNFLRLVDKGFYKGLIFHRVIAGFMIQGGGYDADLNYREPPLDNVPNESSNGLQNVKGTVAMARLADPDSANTQFFINVTDNEHLNTAPGRPGYTVFGRVVDGMDVVTEIELSDTTRKAGMADVPVSPIVIEEAKRL